MVTSSIPAYGHLFSLFSFFILIFFVSRIHDGGPQRVKNAEKYKLLAIFIGTDWFPVILWWVCINNKDIILQKYDVLR